MKKKVIFLPDSINTKIVHTNKISITKLSEKKKLKNKSPNSVPSRKRINSRKSISSRKRINSRKRISSRKRNQKINIGENMFTKKKDYRNHQNKNKSINNHVNSSIINNNFTKKIVQNEKNIKVTVSPKVKRTQKNKPTVSRNIKVTVSPKINESVNKKPAISLEQIKSFLKSKPPSHELHSNVKTQTGSMKDNSQQNRVNSDIIKNTTQNKDIPLISSNSLTEKVNIRTNIYNLGIKLDNDIDVNNAKKEMIEKGVICSDNTPEDLVKYIYNMTYNNNINIIT